MAVLYIVSTPIGNLGDITHRAVAILGEVDRILAEDTRRTSILLKHYGITTPLTSLHAFNEEARAARVLAWLEADEALALVSDAGTPLVSDPGARIVRGVIDAGHRVVPVPGPSAPLAGLVASGLEAVPFTFWGFVPRRGRARTLRLDEVSALDHTSVLFEAPGRVLDLLRDLEARCGPDRPVAVARELTKMHESFVRGTLREALAYYEGRSVRGEVVVMLGGRPTALPESVVPESRMRDLARELLSAGRRPSEVARELSRAFGVPRNRAYEISLAESGEAGGEEA